MLCRLALALQKWPSEVEAAEPSDYYRMVAYYNTEPWGFPREDARFANLTAAVYRSSSKTFTPDSVNDPATWSFASNDPISDDDMIDRVETMFEAMTLGSVKRRGD